MCTGTGLAYVHAYIELNFFDPIPRIYPHDPPYEDRANGHIGALYCQIADVPYGPPLPSPSEQIHYPKWLVVKPSKPSSTDLSHGKSGT